MAMKSHRARRSPSGVQVAVFAKAPLPGFAKSRLIPALGATGAAYLQRAFIRGTVATAISADLGPVTLWCAPDTQHNLFRALRHHYGIQTRIQAEGDLGCKMAGAFAVHCVTGPLLLIGTDCPVLSPAHLRHAAQALQSGYDAVFIPSQDGGYALVGLHEPQPELFEGIPWSTADVLRATLEHAVSLGLRVELMGTLWDVDVPSDLVRLQQLSEAKACSSARTLWSNWRRRVEQAATSLESAPPTTAAQMATAIED